MSKNIMQQIWHKTNFCYPARFELFALFVSDLRYCCMGVPGTLLMRLQDMALCLAGWALQPSGYRTPIPAMEICLCKV